MTLTCVKVGRAATFMKYLANVVSLMFLPKTLNWSKIHVSAIKLMNFAEQVVNELTRVSLKKISNIPFSIRFITVY